MLTCRRCVTGSLIRPHASSPSPGQEESGRPVWRWSSRARAVEGTSRVLFVGLAAVRNAAFVAPAIAEALGVLDATAVDLPRRAQARVRRDADAARARQFRAGPGRGAAGRGSPDSGRRAPSARHQPRPAPCAGRAEYAVGPLALDVDVEASVARRSRPLSRGAALRGAGSGRAT